MFNSTEFPQGITNGAAWYVITGSMQDWNYAFTSNIELTAEISTVKWPPASTLDGYWNDNRESILAFLEFAQKGLKGTVANAQGPIPATIKILQTGKNIANDTTLGDYHRVLMPGTYTVVVSAAGHIPESREVVVHTWAQRSKLLLERSDHECFRHRA
jgi:carboxypeptidase D